MKSINIKRAAAVVAGAAMVASVVTPALAAVGPTQADVNALVANIKANPANTKVIIGTNGAAISDGLAAAKIAAVLASLNYEQTTVGDVTGTKSVTVSTSGSEAVTPTASTQYMELDNLHGSTGYLADGTATTLTKESLGEVLKKQSLVASSDFTGTMASATYYYEDKIELMGGTSGLAAQYSEDTAGTKGHGLYMVSPSGALKYIVDFGAGIPIGPTIKYQETPELLFLGKAYGLNWKETESGKLALFTGDKQEMTEGDTIVQGDYEVTFKSGTRSGDKDYAVFQIKKGDVVKTTGTLTTADSEEVFFGTDKVSISAEYVGYDQETGKGYATIRLGTGLQTLESGDAFPGNTDWVIDRVNTTSGDTKLLTVSLKYQKTYTGTYLTGLAQGTMIDGPITAAGTPLFKVGLAGFGSKSTNYKTTTVWTKGMGDYNVGVGSELIQVKWQSRDGVTQKFTPEHPGEAIVGYDDTYNARTGFTHDILLNTQDSEGHVVKYGVINDKVIYLQSVAKGTDNRYTVKFRVGGSDGELVEVAGLQNNTNASLVYASPTEPINCNLQVLDFVGGTVDRRLISIGNSATCDVLPDAVHFGKALDFPATGGIPKMDLRDVLDQNNPYMVFYDTTGSHWVEVDYYSQPSTGVQAGLYVYDDSTDLFDQTDTTNFAYDYNKYHITYNSIEADGSVLGEATFIVPNEPRNALIQVTGTSTGAAAGQSVLKVGDTISNVKIEAITCPSTVSGTYYKQKGAISPENLVALDSAAAGTYQIVVGGPYVNNVAKAMAAKDMITVEGASYVYAEGNKLLVAGYSATDTTNAANELIQLLKA
ncbi:MAG: hypothetical protein QXO69_01200 [archaeon]